MWFIQRPRCRGAALVIGFAVLILLAAIALSICSRVTTQQFRMESDIAGVRAYELAQSLNNLKIQEVWKAFRAQPMKLRVTWLGGEEAGVSNKASPPHAPDFQDSDWIRKTPGETCTRIKVLSVYKREWTLVRFTTWARTSDDLCRKTVVRKVQRVVRFELGPASAFDYAYFSNNHVSIAGGNLSVFGAVGANGNVDLFDNPLIDGPIFAATNTELGAPGVINGTARHHSLDDYRRAADKLSPPTNPAADPEDKNRNGKIDPGEDSNHNGKLDDFAYQLGYDGTQPRLTMQDQEVMPDFGNLDYYRELSAAYVRPARPDLAEPGGKKGGIVKQLKAPDLDPNEPANYNILIDQSYGFNGELGFRSIESGNKVSTKAETQKLQLAPDRAIQNGNVALIGTKKQPIVVMGPVIVSNDLVIKGVMTGQGMFYTGRNTHVVGDLTYRDGPDWKQNDTAFESTAATNKQKDMIGFAVAGNIVFGDYTEADKGGNQWNTVLSMLKPPYTRTQNLGFSLLDLLKGILDKLNGYDNGLGFFDGDYTKLDGGKLFNDDGSVPLLPNKTFYQSSFPKSYVHSIASNPGLVQGIFYTSHFFGGRLNGMKLQGAVIARDEAIVTNNGGAFYYDPRLSKREPSTYVNLFLPRNAALTVVLCKELSADDAGPTSADW